MPNFVDTLHVAIQSMPHDVTIHEPLWRYIFTGICGIATIIIAIVNIIYIIRLHDRQDKDEKIAKEKERKMVLLKTLILDHNLKYLYSSFEAIDEHLQQLKKEECDRNAVEKLLQTDFKELSEQFIFLLSAVNVNLYKSVLNESDNLHDTLVTNLSDDGILL